MESKKDWGMSVERAVASLWKGVCVITAHRRSSDDSQQVWPHLTPRCVRAEGQWAGSEAEQPTLPGAEV